jgi:lambda family phage minor tail protein L
MSEIRSVAQTPNPSAKVTLFRLDATKIGGDVKYFCQSAYETTGVTFGGVYYTPVDVQFSGFETSGTGALPTPRIKLSNTNGVFQAMVNTYGDLVGCIIQRVRTFRQFLDGQEDADPTAYYGPETYRVERKVSENPVFIEWELAASFDQEGKMLPGRVIVRDTCLWRYRTWNSVTSAFDYTRVQCPYAGDDYFNERTEVVVNPADDRCGRRLSDCKARFGEDGVLPFGGFPGVSRVRQNS